MAFWGGQAQGYPGNDNLPHPEIASFLAMMGTCARDDIKVSVFAC